MDDRTLHGACLSCATPLEPVGRRLGCPACGSCLVPEDAVREALHAMLPAGHPQGPPKIVACAPGTRASRPCPRCARPMMPCLFLLIAIDACSSHGIWFDHDELERVLHGAAPRNPDGEMNIVEVARGVEEAARTLLQLLDDIVHWT